MSYVKHEGASTEYQGESFTKTLLKRDGSVWTADDTATYRLIDKNGVDVDTGSLTKVNADLGMQFEVSKDTTLTLLGAYVLLVYLNSASNTNYADVIAEYTMVYEEAKAK